MHLDTTNVLFRSGFRYAARFSSALLQQRAFPQARARLWSQIVKPHLAWRDIDLIGQTRFGSRIPCHLRDMVQSHILFFGTWEPNIGSFIVRRLGAGDCFVDIGANIGYFSLLGAKCVGTSGKVVAIEASPSIYATLLQNLKRNHCTNVEAINVAAGSQAGTIDVYAAPATNLGMTSTLSSRAFPLEATVRMARLRDILGDIRCRNVRLIKIDIEGAEYPVLSSILEDISHFSSRLEIISEINPDDVRQFGVTASSILEDFEKSGFHAYEIKNDYDDYLGRRPPLRPRRLTEAPERCTDIVFSRTNKEWL